MRKRRAKRLNGLFLMMTCAVLLAMPVRFDAQGGSAPPPQASATRSIATPQWQIDAGGKMAFEVTSIKLNTSGAPPSGDMPYSNFPLGPGDVYNPNGGLF